MAGHESPWGQMQGAFQEPEPPSTAELLRELEEEKQLRPDPVRENRLWEIWAPRLTRDGSIVR